ncbi:MAG: HD domain-containing protein [Lentisphaeria bacterium]|nr:HD domain-containing protein [Lentisphaeria bacterium]
MTEKEICDAALHYFYPEPTPLFELLIRHSKQVAGKAHAILASGAVSPGLRIDPETVTVGCLLHDIGIRECHAPDILCTGAEPYIAHGIIGGRMLRAFGAENGLDLEKYARICERHTGTGLTADEIRRQGLPLPVRDFLPETPEEKLICLADKFYSKSGSMEEKSVERIERSLRKFGPDTLTRWNELCRLFGVR